MIAADLETLAVPLEELSLMPGNPRRGDVGAVARSLGTFGQRKPIVARRDGTVIAGNHTLQAARQLGWDRIAVVWVDDDDTTAKAFALADNRTAELGGYDEAELAALIGEVEAVDAELLAAAGWSEDAVAELLASLEPEQLPAAMPPVSDEVPDWVPAKTFAGDVWLLGPHRLLCGDCRVPTDVDKLLDGAPIHLAFTSPPYAEQREYDPESGFKPIHPDEYVDWWEMVQANVAAHLADDGSFFVNIKEHADAGQRVLYVKDLTVAHVRRWGWRFVDEFAWVRSGVPGKWPNRFKNGWEPIFHFARAEQIKLNHDAVSYESERTLRSSPENQISPTGSGLLGAHGEEPGLALPSNVVTVPPGRKTMTGEHSAEFPLALPQWFMRAYTDSGDNVFDPFIGSGTTLLAAHQEGRVAFGTELSPRYCDVICKRWQLATGVLPVAESTGNPHDFCEDDG